MWCECAAGGGGNAGSGRGGVERGDSIPPAKASAPPRQVEPQQSQGVVAVDAQSKRTDRHCSSRHMHSTSAPEMTERHGGSPIKANGLSSPRQKRHSVPSPKAAARAPSSSMNTTRPLATTTTTTSSQHDLCRMTTRRLQKLEGRLITEEQNSIRVLERVLAFFESMRTEPSTRRRSRKSHNHHSRNTTAPAKMCRPRSKEVSLILRSSDEQGHVSV